MNTLQKHYPQSSVFELKLIRMDNLNKDKLINKYDTDKANFIEDLFQPGKKFYTDGNILANETNNFYMYIHTIKLLKHTNNTNYRVELSIILDENVYPVKNKRSIPFPYKPSRGHSFMIRKPLYIDATFKVVNGLDHMYDGLYVYDTIHDYYDQVAQQEGGKPKKITKQQLIELCRLKKIPYSGRTKEELMLALGK